jgi:hypothetical protein
MDRPGTIDGALAPIVILATGSSSDRELTWPITRAPLPCAPHTDLQWTLVSGRKRWHVHHARQVEGDEVRRIRRHPVPCQAKEPSPMR